MMQQSLSVVLERNTTLTGPFTTEPYEVAWAREARWFVRAIQMEGESARLEATTQISPDGLHWIDLDGSQLTLNERGLATVPAHEFGGWLRLKGTVSGDGDASAKVMIYLVLKG